MGIYNPKEKYLINHWKKMTKLERKALAKNVSWFNLCSNRANKLSLSFIREFEDYINFTQLSIYCELSEDVLDYYKDKNVLVLHAVFMNNRNYSEKFLTDNIHVFKNYIDSIIQTQTLSKETILKFKMFSELIT